MPKRCVAESCGFELFANLFELRPDLRGIPFSWNRFEQQHRRLRAALVLLFEARAERPRRCKPSKSTASSTAGEGVMPHAYAVFLAAGVRAARQAAGGAWNDYLEDAWRTSLGVGIGHMKRAAAPGSRLQLRLPGDRLRPAGSGSEGHLA